MSIDTSKIEVGDWVEVCDSHAFHCKYYGWHRVEGLATDTRSVVLIIPTMPKSWMDSEEKRVNEKFVTAHRPKSGPFKVGDRAACCGRVFTVEAVGNGRLREGEYIAHAKNCTLHRPVEAIEAERDDGVAISVLNEKEQAKVIENLLGGLSDLSLIKGYRIERIEQPVTLADLPKPCEGEWVFRFEEVFFDVGADSIVWFDDATPESTLADIETMSRQLIAEGKLDDAVTERAEVISCD